jgi:hypothetical protein
MTCVAHDATNAADCRIDPEPTNRIGRIAPHNERMNDSTGFYTPRRHHDAVTHALQLPSVCMRDSLRTRGVGHGAGFAV